MDIVLSDYEADRDRDAVIRVWREVGWIEKDREHTFDWFVEGSNGHVAQVDGQAESFVMATAGTMLHQSTEMPLATVTAVTTSRVARRLHLAHRLTARALAAEARRGAIVAALGIFDQGFYDRMGFGTGSYILRTAFDPAQLKASTRPRIPVRLSADDWMEAHAAKLARRRTHGCCNLLPPGVTRGEMSEAGRSFGLGYRDADGQLTHYVWCYTREVSHGPYDVEVVFREPEQFLELMSLLGGLADQVHLVRMREPAGIQLQDLLAWPFRHQNVTRQGKFEVKTTASAYWQARMLDLPACIAAAHLVGPTVAFNLVVTDPLAEMAEETGWPGVGGTYVVALGDPSTCERGSDPALPTLEASIGAFTRLWLGVRPATGLAIGDHLRGPADLLRRLDEAIRLPDPQPDWDF